MSDQLLRREAPMERRVLCFVTLVAVALPTSIAAQSSPEPLWISQFGSTGNELLRTAASDAQGVFVAGGTTGHLAAPNQGRTDVFLARYDRDGQQQWVRQFGTSESDLVRGAATDGAGGVYIGGFMQQDAWLARYDADGNRHWLREPLLASPGAHINAMASDPAGAVFVGGRTAVANVIVARVSDAGAAMWIRTFGSSGAEAASAMTPDGAGGVFVAGTTNGSLGAPIVGFQDVWMARYDSEGNRLWLRQWGDPIGGAVGVQAAAPDGAGGVYLSGLTGGPSSHTQYIARFNSAGEQLWIRLHTGFDIQLRGLAADDSGGVFVAGHHRGEVSAPNWWGSDVFLARYDSSGMLLWLKEFGTLKHDWGAAAAPDFVGGIYLAGETTGNIANLTPPPPQVRNIFIARFPSGDPEPCYANCDGSTVEPILTVDDFTCFINELAAASALPPAQQIGHYANCDGSTTEPILTVDDFTCFINAFAAGCP